MMNGFDKMTVRIYDINKETHTMTDQQGGPMKLVIEPTTRCNFKCSMCVKQSLGCRIKEGDLSDEVFERCSTAFKNASSIIFTGIGEPLLHPKLDQFIQKAAALSPLDCNIGFQTNGKLLTRQSAVRLLQSGLNTICISVDSITPAQFDDVREGGSLKDVETAFGHLDDARQQLPDTALSMGIEFVLMQKNLGELPDVVTWAAKRGVEFVIVSHLTAYEPNMEKEQVYLNNSHNAVALLQKFRNKAAQMDLDIMSYSPKMVKFYNTRKERQLCEQVTQLKEEALKNEIYLNLFHLLAEPPGEYERVRAFFDEAEKRAKASGISLTLPRIRPAAKRCCRFIEEDTVFITWEGRVSPCYFLWHRYACMRAGYTKQVDPLYFGDITDTPLEIIWNEPEFERFRRNVKKYDYPNCHSWCDKRCDYVLEAPFAQDCYINEVPCADCQWNIGFLNCL
jgi:putative metalloenzyme radical SAM/SPASM domain maturase